VEFSFHHIIVPPLFIVLDSRVRIGYYLLIYDTPKWRKLF